MENKNFDVFISYSRKDMAVARKIFKSLTNADISCFFDEKLDNPDLWTELINCIENCKVFLYLGSQNTAAARITPKELTYAVNHKDKSYIYPYFIDESELPKVHEFLLADINWRRQNSHPIETGLIPDLKHLLSVGFIPSKPMPQVSGEIFSVSFGDFRLEMLRVEGGPIDIGATLEQKKYSEPNEYPPHRVVLPTFYMSKYPITQNVWKYVMGYNKSYFQNKERLNDIFDNYPAETLKHDEAQEFVRRLSKLTNIPFSLPTEEEWEYAARGGQKSQGFIYSGSDIIDEVAWFRDNSNGTTHPVGLKMPNELGLFDMSGNIWEWTQTPAHSYELDVTPGGNVFVRRGGSWYHKANNCRVSKRYNSDHEKKTKGLGMRVVIRDNVN